jgi:hypothetical protein
MMSQRILGGEERLFHSEGMKRSVREFELQIPVLISAGHANRNFGELKVLAGVSVKAKSHPRIPALSVALVPRHRGDRLSPAPEYLP